MSHGLAIKDSALVQPYFQVRGSEIHGYGAFARRAIPKGTRIIEYAGERITPAEADRRVNAKDDDSHTVLFALTKRTILDASVHGNEARFINHSCDPNCEALIERGHIYIEALCDIAVGQELVYDYQIEIDGRITKAERERFACYCGSAKCRGTMIMLNRRQRTP